MSVARASSAPLKTKGSSCNQEGSLKADKERLNSLQKDFHSHTGQKTDDVIDALHFAQDLREKFATGTGDEKLEILHRVGQTLELEDKLLDFKFSKPFSAFKRGNDELKKNFKRSTLSIPLADVPKDQLSQCVQVWYSILEEVRTVGL